MSVKPAFYDCGICECYHPAEWDGDCRDDENRFHPGQLDDKYGVFGWDEVPMPVAGDLKPSRYLP